MGQFPQQGQGQQQTRDDSGVLFVNDRKTEEKHPDSKGRAMIGGRWYWVSAWRKQGQQSKFLSLAFEPMTDEYAAKYGGNRSHAAPAAGSGRQQQQSPTQQQRRPAPQADRGPFGDAPSEDYSPF